MALFNNYEERTDGAGLQYVAIIIDSKRFGRLEVLMDKADFDEYREEVGRKIFAREDDRGIWATYVDPDSKYRRERQLHSWVMRRALLNNPDHRVHCRDGNMLNCRRNNLELRTHSQSGHAAVRKEKASGLPRGVTETRNRKKRFMARIWVEGKAHYLGNFTTPEEAERARRRAKERLLGPS